MSQAKLFRREYSRRFDARTCLEHRVENCASCYDAAMLAAGRPRRPLSRGGATKTRKLFRASFGEVMRVAPRKGGALAHCAECSWGQFFEDRKRLKYSAMARAAAALREHVRRQHKASNA
jgi:hypothetical protein